MNYYSTKNKNLRVPLSQAVIKGLAPDKGLFMPERIEQLPETFFRQIENYSLQEIAVRVASAFFGDDVESGALKKMVEDTLNFDIPLVTVSEHIHSLELFHGPTMAFKDVGARFMARLSGYFIGKENRQVNVLVATSGDTGSAVANGFLGIENIHVYVLYPKGKVSEIQEKQFTTLGKNITAIEIDGTFDDCQRLVKQAFADPQLNREMLLTSANSINVARFLPQAFYYFHGYARLKRAGKAEKVVFSVPSGNFGNLTAGLFAARMGLPVHRFIAANNRNDVFLDYLHTGNYAARASVQTIANAMDVGDPSNFDRILDLYDHNHPAIAKRIAGFSYDDDQIRATLKKVYDQTGYLLDPHGACGYQALEDGLQEGENGIFLETAHPAKFLDTVAGIIDRPIPVPTALQKFLTREKKTQGLSNEFPGFRTFLLTR